MYDLSALICRDKSGKQHPLLFLSSAKHAAVVVVVWGNGEGGYNNGRPYIIKMEYPSIKGMIKVIDIQRPKEEERGECNLKQVKLVN